MNFNYDLMTWIDYFIGAFVCCFGSFIIGKILLNKCIKVNIINIIIMLILSIFTIINSLVFDNILKIFGILIVMFVIYKLIFKESTTRSISFAIATYMLFVLGDLTIAIILSLLMIFIKSSNDLDIVKTILGNVLVLFFVFFYAIKLKKIINKIISKIGINEITYVSLLGIITIFILISSMYNLYLNNWRIDYKFIINIIVFVGCLILAIVLLKQYLENKEINNKYLLLEDYLKNSAELIEKYNSTVHKYKNNLIAIKGYLKTDEKKANSYIDDLLETYEFKKYGWFNKINNIKFDVLRYLIYYKLSKAENNNLNIVVDVSKDLTKYENDILSIKESNILLDIVGELFDNAIYASKESKDKEINIIINEEDNNIKFILSNTYKGKIDLSLINKNGYTTKGNGHGVGLYDIDKIIKKYDIFNIKYEIIDNYFVANLRINLYEKNKI